MRRAERPGGAGRAGRAGRAAAASGRAVAAVLASALLAGTAGAAGTLAGRAGAQPLEVGIARTVLGAAILVAIAGGRGALRGPWRPWPLLAAGAGVAVFQVSFFHAVRAGGIAVATVVTLAAHPILAAGLARVVLGERVPRRWYPPAALGVGGLVLLLLEAGTGPVRAQGLGLAVVAGAGFALLTVGSKLLLADRGPLPVMAAVAAAGAALLLPVAPAGSWGWLATPGGLAAVTYLGLVTTAAVYVLYATGLARLPVRVAGLLLLAEPLTASALGVALFGERLGAGGLAGAAFLLASLALLSAMAGRERPGARV